VGFVFSLHGAGIDTSLRQCGVKALLLYQFVAGLFILNNII